MNRIQLIKSYIDFFKSKGHKEIENSSLIPKEDPTVLFTTAGMHPLVPYLLGQKHPLGKKLCNVQRCLRTDDIDEVGDEFHHTFFEMLGNWSLGDYWKKEVIEMSFEFLTQVLKIPKEKIEVTCFVGDKDAEKDSEAAEVWKKLGIKKIKFLEKKDNWWGPAGKTGPCGPDTEMFVNGCEIWNDVFMQYKRDKRVILVDGMHCLYDDKFGINKELLEIINNLNSHCILTVNGFREKGFNLIKNHNPNKNTNWQAFSLEEHGIKKDNPEYFKRLLATFGLDSKETIYFDHDKNNVKTAEKLGILSKHYNSNKEIKKFIEDDLYSTIPAKQKNVDTGMGVERTLAIINGLNDNYLTDSFKPIIDEIEHLSGKEYSGKNKKIMRIIADHIKASVFIIAEGITPGNKEQGYVLRRLLRRTIINLRKLGFMGTDLINPIADKVYEIYLDYKILHEKREFIYETIKKEEEKFEETLEKGLNLLDRLTKDKKNISGKDSFLLFQSYGFPIEMTLELAKEKNIKVSLEEFKEELKKHQELSRTAAEGKFKSGLADHSESTTRLHTTTHLLLSALRKVLKDEKIIQKGSNITPERLRFDFSFDRKLTDEEIKKAEALVNEQIKKKINVVREEMSLEQARKSGALGIFGEKYGERVSVYTIGNFSKEICTGPHVKNTADIGNFKIVKEESSSSGVRRIKAVVE
ncbi:MAG: alanine--tRNA ligase-related protein [Nanoarchaeota archaeon]